MKTLIRLAALALTVNIACGADADGEREASDDDVIVAPLDGADFGDAPDGRLNADGRLDDEGYPTVLASNGARALDVDRVALAASPSRVDISRESDANSATDPDGEPNFVRFDPELPDSENRDDFDNGIVEVAFDPVGPNGPRYRVTVGAVLKDAASAGTYYLNVLFDRDVDGAWNGADFGDDAPDLGPLDEWVVRNRALELVDTATVVQTTFDIGADGPRFALRHLASIAAPYMRIALSSEPIASSTWVGEGEFAVGEIEDWRFDAAVGGPDLVCDLATGLDYIVDFRGADQVPMACDLFRPLVSSSAQSFDMAYRFRQIRPAGSDVRIDCVPNPSPGVARVPVGADSVPLDCVATKTGPVRTTTPTVKMEITAPTEDGTAIVSGKGSRVDAIVHYATGYFDFIDTPGPEPESVTACVGVTGSYAIPRGGLVLLLSEDKQDCSLIPNDGNTPGSLIVGGGTGFRGVGEMTISLLVPQPGIFNPGVAVSATLDGTPLTSPIFFVPVDVDSTQVLSLRFDSGFEIDVQIDIAYNPDGLNTVTQTVIAARCQP